MANTTNFNWETPDDTDLVKDGAAAIRTLGSSIDTSFVDLKGGTTGQILSKASNTDLDYTWVANDQGDITEVQAGTGISVASGTGPVPTVSIDTAVTADLTTAQTLTNKTLTSPVLTTPTISTIDAKGDLLVGTADNTIGRLAVGTNDYVLTAASGETTGLKWAAPAAGGANWSLLNSGGTALTGATSITVSSISGKDKIMVLVAGASADASAGFFLRLNADSGNNYSRLGYESSGTIDVSNQFATSQIALCDLSNNAASVASGYFLFSGCNAAGLKIYNSVGSANAAGGSGQKTFIQGGFYNSASTISSVTLHSSSGNFDAGTIYVYTSA